MVVPGPQSFEDLWTVTGIEYSTFWEACRACGLLDDNREWVSCFMDAVAFTSGHHLRILFSMVLIHGYVSDPLELWDEFKEHFCDDLQHRLQVRGLEGLEIPDEMCDRDLHLDYGLFLISEHLAAGGRL